MIEFLAMASGNPLDILPKSKYPALENSIYTYAYPSSTNPVIKIPYRICEADNVCADEGIYEIQLAIDNDYFILMQSRKIVMRIPVLNVEEVKREPEKIEEMLPSKERKKLKKARKKEEKEKKPLNEEKKFLKAAEDYRKQAKLQATIEDSKMGYFIINYYDGRVRATGHVKY